jgi:ApbE superfamily uncharacterized protein (UPF0280 family)
VYEERKYRNLVNPAGLVSFKAVVQETDLQVYADRDLKDETRDLILQQRGYVEAYIQNYPEFVSTCRPWPTTEPMPKIVADMTKAAAQAGVGPMAAVAGAIAEHVGRALLKHTDQVIVENGGDIFIQTHLPVTVGVWANASPLSMRIGLQLGGNQKPAAVCTSSGTVGHSLSLGNADAVCVVAESCALADAAATSIANRVGSPSDIDAALIAGQGIADVLGIVVIIGDKLGVWGQLEVVPLGG